MRILQENFLMQMRIFAFQNRVRIILSCLRMSSLLLFVILLRSAPRCESPRAICKGKFYETSFDFGRLTRHRCRAGTRLCPKRRCGRVFYCSLGHHDDTFDSCPEASVLMERGMLWAADGKDYAEEHHLDVSKYTEKKC